MMAKRFRTCPPSTIKSDPDCRVLLSEHMKTCPHCRNETPGREPWRELLDGVFGFFGLSSENTTGPPSPGEVRAVKREKGRWREGLYLNPPVVVVLEAVRKARDTLVVAQIYHDTAMAAPGDLILEYPGAPGQTFFIEAWNTYRLVPSDLGAPLFSIPPGTMEAVKAIRADQNFVPPDFPVAVPLGEGDPRFEFREMEIDTARAFSLGAAAPDDKARYWVYGSAAEVMDAVKAVAPGAVWRFSPGTVPEALLLARIPDEMLPLAAADAESGFFALLYMSHKGRVVSLSPLRFQVFRDVRIDNLKFVSGSIRGGSQELSGTDFICLYSVSRGRTVSPSRSAWNDETGDFYAEFPVAGLEEKEGEISIALIKEADGL